MRWRRRSSGQPQAAAPGSSPTSAPDLSPAPTLAGELPDAGGEPAHATGAAASSPEPVAQCEASRRSQEERGRRRAQRGEALTGWLTGAVGSVVEAWGQVRIARMRVLLSLVGVALAVAAMTFVIAFGGISQQVQKEMMVTWNGRPGTVTARVTPTLRGDAGDLAAGGMAGPGAPGTASNAMSPAEPSQGLTEAEQRERLAADIEDFTERYGVTRWATSTTLPSRMFVATGAEPLKAQVTLVSGGYGLLHSVQLSQGRWFTAEDGDDLSPAVVVSANLLQALGRTTLTEPIALHGLTPAPMTYTVVGVLEGNPSRDRQFYCDQSGCQERESYQMYVLDQPYLRLLGTRAQTPLPALEVWAGQGRGREMALLMREYFMGKYGKDAVELYSNEDDGRDMAEFQRIFTLVVTGAGAAVMLLGALGLINISLVTVRHRIHEIGVRRAFGATSRRVFFSIMMESVVATVVAGVVGIMIAILATRVVPWERVMDFPLQHTPAFPMSAALIGLVTAAGVGALAGILPAVVAVRIRPIDAIRF